MRAVRLRAILGATGFASFLLCPGRAASEPSAQERAAAEALFQQGTELMADKRFAPACEKFEGSQQLDPALGTMLRLADCYDRVGRSASAWALFKDAVSFAHTRNEPDRERMAGERAADLEKRLSKIELHVDRKNAPTGLEIQLNGAPVPRATWDAPIPVDPGHLRLAASAPDRVAWSTTLDVSEGPAVRAVEIPALAPKLHQETPDAHPLATPHDSRASTQRTAGYVAGGLAIAGLAVGGFLGYKAYDSKQQSLSQCRVDDANACTQQGKDLRDDAKHFANGATLAFVGGGALLGGAIVLLVSAHATDARPSRELKASADVTPSAAGIRLEGTW